jgi:hypothetical protein
VNERRPVDRRSAQRSDRRHHPRGGRRRSERRAKWQRFTWLFAAYLLYLGGRVIPAALRRALRRQTS